MVPDKGTWQSGWVCVITVRGELRLKREVEQTKQALRGGYFSLLKNSENRWGNV